MANIPSALADLRKAVVEGVIERLGVYEGEEPLACLHLIYYETTAPSGYIELSATTESKRDELYADDAADFWDGWGEPGNVPLGELSGGAFDSAYDYLCEDGKEEENMAQYRAELARIALELNKGSMPDFLHTDDFVIVLGDGSRWTGGCDPADVLDCITKDQRKLLIEHGFWTDDDRY